jgi:hypothetical protein
LGILGYLEEALSQQIGLVSQDHRRLILQLPIVSGSGLIQGQGGEVVVIDTRLILLAPGTDENPPAKELGWAWMVLGQWPSLIRQAAIPAKVKKPVPQETLEHFLALGL